MLESSGGDFKPSCQVRLVGRVGNAREIMENFAAPDTVAWFTGELETGERAGVTKTSHSRVLFALTFLKSD